MTEPQITQPVDNRLQRRWLRRVIFGTLLGTSFVTAGETGRVLLGRNLHEILPGKAYRSAQLDGKGLEQVVKRYDIKTVINLRGCCDPKPEYLDECRATRRLGVSQEDVCFSAGRLPSTHELRRLMEVLDRTEYPILVHCKRGSDRTGLASALLMMLHTDCSLEEARGQLGLRYGHVALGRPANLDVFFDLYAEWLGRTGQTHSREAIRRWIDAEYCPGSCSCKMEIVSLPESFPIGRQTMLQVLVRNTSVRPWQFRSGNNAGIHIGFDIWDAEGGLMMEGRSGLFDAELAPGRTRKLDLSLPAFEKPGKYRLRIDMREEQHCWFYQTGSEPLELEIDVR